jgi:hypothetical protein
VTFKLKHGQSDAKPTFRLGEALPRDGISGHWLGTDSVEATVQVRLGFPMTCRFRTDHGSERQ